MTDSAQQPSFFFDKFGLSDALMERCLGEALSAGGDYAELYFESVASTSLGIDESLVKSASQGVSAGCGIRVLSGERTGYAYTDELSADRLLRAARTAALIASGPAKQTTVGLSPQPLQEGARPLLYPAPAAELYPELRAKLALVMRADRAARAYAPRVTEVRASYWDEVRRILVVASDGTYASDTQPLLRLNVFVLAKEGDKVARGTSGGGGRVTGWKRTSTAKARLLSRAWSGKGSRATRLRSSTTAPFLRAAVLSTWTMKVRLRPRMC